MIWIYDINDLQYYHPVPGFPCYCDPLVYPEDLLLQALIGGSTDVVGSGLAVKIEVYSNDGQTFYEDASSYFNWVYTIAPNGNKYVNIQLGNGFSPAMYTYGSFILKVTITSSLGDFVMTHFGAFTESYCIPCCPVPSDITIVDGGAGELGEYSPLEYSNEYYNIT